MFAQKIYQLFEQIALTNADRQSVVCDSDFLTYQELNIQANQFSHYLVKAGVKPGDLVPILLDKSCLAVAVILGILKAGAVYVPMDVYNAEKSTADILEHTRANLIVSQSSYLKHIEHSSIQTINIDDWSDIMFKLPKNNPNIQCISDIAYVIYTSGTTGDPKGVLVTHKNLLATYQSWADVYKLAPTDTHLQMANMSFDVFTGDWVRALCSGGKLILCKKGILLHPESLYTLINKEKITCAEFVPIVLRQLLNYVESKKLIIDSFRIVICGSDQWTMGEYRHAKSLFPQARIINSYGLTETTIDSTYFEESAYTCIHLSTTDIVPAGKPFKHAKVYLYDEQMNPVKSSRVGEIYIGGAGITLGYLGRPDLTKERFITIQNDPDELIYRTGDFGQWLADGNIAFLGRNQRHIKINGKRVELSSLEGIVNQHKKIEQVVVLAETCSCRTIINCYFTLLDTNISYSELMKFIKTHFTIIPMLFRFYRVSAIAITSNGKIDRLATVKNIVSEIKDEIIKPRNQLENELLNIWQDMLKSEEIGINHNFFDMGGSSLSYACMLKRIENHLKLKLPQNLEVVSISELAQQIKIIQNHTGIFQ